MKRRTLIRKAALGSLFVAGVGSAEASPATTDDGKFVMVERGDTWTALRTTDDDVSTEDGCNCYVECCGDCAGRCSSGCCKCDKFCTYP